MQGTNFLQGDGIHRRESPGVAGLRSDITASRRRTCDCGSIGERSRIDIHLGERISTCKGRGIIGTNCQR